jgi:Fur family ferric uptake transcriptional regulator
MDQNLQSLLESLKSSHLKVTEARIAILRAMLKNHGPFAAEELHKHVTKKVCDLATVYRFLTALEEAGLVQRCEFGDGISRYELWKKEEHHHHHVICRKCKQVEVLDDCELQDLNQFAEKRGFINVAHSLEFFGICPACK